MRERREQPAEHVEDRIAGVAEAVFDVVAEDPEVPHVPDEVEPPAMEEHGHHHLEDVQRDVRRRPETRRDEREREQRPLDVRTKRQFPEKKEDIRRDQQRVDDRNGAAWVVIRERQHYREKYLS